MLSCLSRASVHQRVLLLMMLFTLRFQIRFALAAPCIGLSKRRNRTQRLQCHHQPHARLRSGLHSMPLPHCIYRPLLLFHLANCELQRRQRRPAPWRHSPRSACSSAQNSGAKFTSGAGRRNVCATFRRRCDRVRAAVVVWGRSCGSGSAKGDFTDITQILKWKRRVAAHVLLQEDDFVDARSA